MRHFRGVPTLIQFNQTWFSNTLPTKDPTKHYTTCQYNTPLLDIEIQQILFVSLNNDNFKGKIIFQYFFNLNFKL